MIKGCLAGILSVLSLLVPLWAFPPGEDSDFERTRPVKTSVDGVPVYAFGDTFVYGVSPDFTNSLKIQEGNDKPLRKIRPKKSWEISSNKLGATPPRLPRTQAMDFQPLLSVNLLDGDPETYWCSRGVSQSTAEPVWIRIDLPKESTVSGVRLLPRRDVAGWPEQLTIKTSRDAWHWETVYENHRLERPASAQAIILSFAPRPAKQIWITANQYGQVERFGYCFSLAELEVLDGQGTNLASFSRGAGVTVSSTNYGYLSHRLLHENLWPIHYDLGLKLVRIAYWDSVLQWHFVEREKGKYQIDLRTDQVISETVGNGVDVTLCLAYSNWLYTAKGKRDRAKQLWEIPFEEAPLPTTSPELLDGYANFVRFMVRHFRDRIHAYEIWNEPVGAPNHGWGPTEEGAREFARLLKRVIPIIREEHPRAKIWVGSNDALTEPLTEEFLLRYLAEGIAPLVDVIDLQPKKQADPESPEFREYATRLRRLKEKVRALGFQGDFVVEEFAWSAPYPAPNRPLARNDLVVTEVTKAKYLSRFALTNLGLDTAVYWNETWQDQFSWWSIGLLRNTFSADPVNPQQPEVSYYVLRTLCTVLEDTKAEPLDVVFQGRKDLEWWTFAQGKERLLAVWIPGRASDESSGVPVDITVRSLPCKQAVGIDVLNGVSQELSVGREGKDTVIRGVLVKDYPTLIRLSVAAPI